MRGGAASFTKKSKSTAAKVAKETKKKVTKQILPEPTEADYEHDRYVCTLDTLNATLDKYGVAIIDSVIPAGDCENIKNKFWDFVENATSKLEKPIQRNDPSTYLTLWELIPTHGFLLQHFGIGHAQCNWDVRQHPAIVSVFAKLYNVQPEELLVSFDGASFGVPFEDVNSRGVYKNHAWYHVDQRLNDSSFKCVQSWFTPLEVRPGDATLTIVESSHRYHAEFAKQWAAEIPEKDKAGDWYKFSHEQLQFYLATKGLARKYITCPPGSIVLWDSRTVHAGAEAMKWRAQPNFRMVSYICMQPRSYATEKDLQKKRAAFEDKRTTTHWAARVKLFGKYPQTYGKPVPNVPPIASPQLTALGRRLAGFSDDVDVASEAVGSKRARDNDVDNDDE